MNPRVRLAVTAALFVGWLGWLGYTALTKSRAPVVSRAQAAGATTAVVAEVEAGAEGRPAPAAKVVERLSPTGPEAGAVLNVENLPSGTGYTGPGKYLLLLAKTADGYALVGGQRSPGADLSGARDAALYPWSDATAPDLRTQAKKLFP